MSKAEFRTPAGGRIDRGRPVNFTFNGQALQGYAGDTLASALLANGVHLVGRSFKYHRPRGILSAGSEEPNALIQLERGNRTEPNLRATQIEIYEGLSASSQNAWPNVETDVGAVNNVLSKIFVAGFYYKTFMHPQSFWMKVYEPVIRRAAGLGKAPAEPDPDFYDKMHIHCDVLVVGAGPAGLMAALAAAKTGARVILADEQNEFGGSLLASRETIDGTSGRRLGPRHGRGAEALPRSPPAAAHHRHRLLRPQLPDHGGAPHRPSAARVRAQDLASAPVEGPRQARSCWRPARTNARWCSPTTTVPASCWPTPPAPTSTASARCRASAPSS